MFYILRILSLFLSITMPLCFHGQELLEKQKKKEVGQPTLSIDVGVIMEANDILNKPSQGVILGLEKGRQRLVFGPTFGLNIFIPKVKEIIN